MQTIDHQKPHQQILFINDLEQIIGRNRLTLRRWWLAGKFPKPVRLNGSDLAWHSSAINEWIEQSLTLPASKSIN